MPLPPHAYLAADEAERFASDLLSPERQNICGILDSFIRQHQEQGKPQHDDTVFWYHQFRARVSNQELVLRTMLRQPDEWKRSLENSESYSDFRSILNSLPMPERIWVVEISWPEVFTHTRGLCGEIVIDPTCLISRQTPTLDQAWLWIHVPGVICHRNGMTSQQGVSVLEGRDTIRFHHQTGQREANELGGRR